jgi:hypothetical protein
MHSDILSLGIVLEGIQLSKPKSLLNYLLMIFKLPLDDTYARKNI